MSANDIIIIDKLLEQRRAEDAPDLSPDKYFELFAAEQVLKDYDLSAEELESGIVGAGGDGGVDAAYLFVNGDLLRDDYDLSGMKKNISLELVLIQSKLDAGFAETTLDKLTATTEDLLDLSKDLSLFEKVYNQGLLSIVDRFRDVYGELASKLPALHAKYYYVTRATGVHPNVERKVDRLKDKVHQLFSSATFGFEFIGAPRLLELVRRLPRSTYTLNVSESPISSRGSVAFICLVSLADYFQFIADESGNLRRALFEANVRDYQGEASVNEGIQNTLRDRQSSDEFWWLNNGVTIVAGKATLGGKTLTLEDPQIVNGLQTSTEIFEYFNQVRPEQETRNVLIRVIVPTTDVSRDKIIKATNSQTPIPPASLHATEKIHRDIEEFFRPIGLFYDRRKNFYRNEGKPIEKIISIEFLAQAVMAISLQRPDSARARPSSLLKKADEYNRVFHPSTPLDLYLCCAGIMKNVDKFLRIPGLGISKKDQTNLRFYVAMLVAAYLAKVPHPNPRALTNIARVVPGPDMIAAAYQNAHRAYVALGPSDQTAKGPELVKRLKSELQSDMRVVSGH